MNQAQTERWFADRPYWALCGVLFLAMLLRTANGVWGGDFWEHAAVIRELMTHPANPTHPLIATDTPNAFMTPYTVALAAVARWCSLSPIGVLSLSGMVNLALLFVAFQRFVVSLFGPGRTAFYCLLFQLFLWGWQPWEYSGFLHFGALGYVLPYPSTLAIACVLFAFSLTMSYLDRPRFSVLLSLFGLSVFVLLIHSLSALLLVAGQGSLIVSRLNQNPLPAVARGLHLAAAFSVAIAAAALWPYFPFLDLITESVSFHDSNPEMYEGVLLKTLPALLGLPALWLRFRENRFDPLVIMFASLTAIYTLGWFSEHWTYGRVLAFMVLILHLAMADWLAQRESRAFTLPAVARSGLTVGTLALATFAAVNFRHALLHILPTTPNSYGRYLFLEKEVGQYEVVLADIRTSWYVPPFGGKVVACRSMAFIPDREERFTDVERFFEPKTSPAERRLLLDKYEVDYLLLNKQNRAITAAIHPTALEWGESIYSDANFELLRAGDR